MLVYYIKGALSRYLQLYKKLAGVFASIEFQNYRPGFVIKDYLKVLKLFPDATDGMEGSELKLEKIGQFFRVLMLRVKNSSGNLLWLPSDKIHLISSS